MFIFGDLPQTTDYFDVMLERHTVALHRTMPALQPSPPASCDLTDPIVLHEISRLPHSASQNAYLLALAAFQRGLSVRFHDNLLSHPSFAELPVQGLHGEMLSISDGSTTRYFRRSLAETVPVEVTAHCDDKQAAKATLNQAGVLVPPGLVVITGQEPDIHTLLQRYPEQRFLLKPLFGSLGQGVIRNISPQQVPEAIAQVAGDPHLLEVQLSGREFRVTVLAGELVAVREQLPAHVVGNGQQSVEALIRQYNRWRSQHPLYRNSPITLDDQSLALLQQQGLALTSVPAVNKRVWLSQKPDYLHGGITQACHPEDITDTMRAAATLAAKALGVAFTGLDMIVLQHGTPDEQAVVLELNACPYLIDALGGFPLNHHSGSNRVAEALIDHHFPNSVDQPRHPQATFDLASILPVLEAGAAASVQLPTLGEDWQHARMTLPQSATGPDTLHLCVRRAREAGLHARFIRMGDGQVVVEAVGPKAHVEQLKGILAGATQ